ncbi:MAG TPA: ADP-ribosylglycohydrolase family protein [Geothermobacteraceae bacterium]|nr:ADP-ribosylglycohydrolase family protein [Geothermobacteraceae bacterium]
MVSANKFRGCLLGVLCGDVLGAPVEGLSAAQIRRRHGRVTAIIPGADGFARYTDDTEMTLSLARSLVRCDGRVDAADCAVACAADFDPQRGYGRSAVTVLQALQAGADWQQTGELLFPGGSFGNGAAMRIAPLGLLYGTAPPAVLRQAVKDAVAATHVHPEAIEGAVLLARTIGRARDLEPSQADSLRPILTELSALCQYGALTERLGLVTDLLRQQIAVAVAQRQLGSGVRTLDSVPFAIYLALRFAAEPLAGLLAAVNAGGDTDTVAAMSGAILGALHGDHAFPEAWLGRLESGENGLEGVLELAGGLYRLFAQYRSGNIAS